MLGCWDYSCPGTTRSRHGPDKKSARLAAPIVSVASRAFFNTQIIWSHLGAVARSGKMSRPSTLLRGGRLLEDSMKKIDWWYHRNG